jgi:hypothetical protein
LKLCYWWFLIALADPFAVAGGPGAGGIYPGRRMLSSVCSTVKTAQDARHIPAAAAGRTSQSLNSTCGDAACIIDENMDSLYPLNYVRGDKCTQKIKAQKMGYPRGETTATGLEWDVTFRGRG